MNQIFIVKNLKKIISSNKCDIFHKHLINSSLKIPKHIRFLNTDNLEVDQSEFELFKPNSVLTNKNIFSKQETFSFDNLNIKLDKKVSDFLLKMIDDFKIDNIKKSELHIKIINETNNLVEIPNTINIFNLALKIKEKSKRNFLPTNLAVILISSYYTRMIKEFFYINKSIQTGLINFSSSLNDLIFRSLLQQDALSRVLVESTFDSKITKVSMDHIFKDLLYNYTLDPDLILKILKSLHLNCMRYLSSRDIKVFLDTKDDLEKIVTLGVNRINNVRLQKPREGQIFSAKKLDSRNSISKLLNQVNKILEDQNKVLISIVKDGLENNIEAINMLVSMTYLHRSVNSKYDFNDPVNLDRMLFTVKGGSEPRKLNQEEILVLAPELEIVLDEITDGIKYDSTYKGFHIVNDFKFHTSVKAGPNGEGCLAKVPLDAIAVFNDKNLHRNLEEWFSSLEISGFNDLIDNCVQDEVIEQQLKKYNFNDISKLSHSKFAFINELGGKQRIVAECDWFSQTALKPVEEIFRSFTESNLKYGGAFNQEESFRIAHRFILESGESECADLTAATDFMPLHLQSYIVERVMLKATGISGLGKIWSRIVSDRDFNIPGSNETCRYEVGQPMGIKSSWIVMHIGNYCINRIAQIRAYNINPNGIHKFQVVGDDVVQSSRILFEEYTKILNDLNMPINLNKCLSSKVDKDNSTFFEYLKIIGVGRHSFRPIPPRVFVSFLQKPDLHIYELITPLLKSNISFRFDELILYFIKSINIRNKLIIEDELSGSVRKLDEVIESLFVYLYADKTLGGLGLAKEYLITVFNSKIVYYLLKTFKETTLTNESTILYLKSRLYRRLAAQEAQIEKSIISVLSDLGFKELRSIFKGENLAFGKVNLSADSSIDEIVTIIKNQKFLIETPLFNSIMAILFKEHFKVQSLKNEIRSKFSDIDQNISSLKSTSSDIERARNLVDEYSSHQFITIDSLIPTEKVETPNVNGLSNSIIGFLKRASLDKARNKELQSLRDKFTTLL